MKLKRILALMMVLAMAFAIAACSSGGATGGGGNFESFKTIGEYLDMEADNTQWGASGNTFVFAFEKDGSFYRAIADMTDKESQALFDVDYSDEDYEEQQNAIIAPLQVVKFEKLDDQILSEEECASLVGKTGQDLLDDGWNTGMGYNLENNEFWMGKGPFYYTVIFDGDLSGVDVDTFDAEEGIKALTVQSVELYMLGDATTID